MNMPEIDPRLEGKGVRDITDKFIRENATEEELSTIYKEDVEEFVETRVDLEWSTPESSLEFANNLLDALVSKVDAKIEYLECDSAYITHKQLKQKTINPIDYLKKLWKNQICELEEFQKEYEEWLRLNEKFGEEN
jgi:hypothetical protein